MFIERTNAKDETQHFGHLMQRTDSLENTLMVGSIEGKRRRVQHRMRFESITDSMNMNLRKLGDSEGQSRMACCSPWMCKESDMT